MPMRATRASRPRSNFKVRTRNNETTIEETRKPSGGYGYMNNRCACKSCRGGGLF